MRLWHSSSAVLATALAVAWMLGGFPIGAEEKSRGGADAMAPAADAAKGGKTADVGAKGKDSRLIVYVPPNRGAVGARTGGGTRGPANAPRIGVLAPDHVGLTTRAQPALAWYISAPTTAPIELTLIADDAAEPLAVKRLPSPTSAGVQVVDLAKQGVQLAEGTTYDWYVALVLDPKARDSDVVAGGAIQRHAPTPELTKDLASGEPSYRVLARNGIWYDAIADLSAAIAAAPASSPAGRDLRAERADLLEQVGVGAAAVYDRGPRAP